MTEPVPVLRELPPELLAVVEFVTLKKFPANTLFASPACVNTDRALKLLRLAAAVWRTLRLFVEAFDVSTKICVYR